MDRPDQATPTALLETADLDRFAPVKTEGPISYQWGGAQRHGTRETLTSWNSPTSEQSHCGSDWSS